MAIIGVKLSPFTDRRVVAREEPWLLLHDHVPICIPRRTNNVTLDIFFPFFLDASLFEAQSVRRLVGWLIGWLVRNTFINFDEITIFSDSDGNEQYLVSLELI